MVNVNGTNIYISNECLEALKEVEIEFWPLKAKKHSEKILSLIYFYKQNKDK